MNTEGGFDNIFTVPKSSGKARLILNLRSPNSFMKYEQKMEDVHSIKDPLSKGDFMCKLYLKDAYLTVPVHLTHQSFQHFQWQEMIHQYTDLGWPQFPGCL